MDVIEQVAAVVTVLLLLIGTLWWLRRRGFAVLALPGRGIARRMECLERIPLGPQHALHLIRLGDTDLVVASSPGSCSVIHTAPHGEGEVRR